MNQLTSEFYSYLSQWTSASSNITYKSGLDYFDVDHLLSHFTEFYAIFVAHLLLFLDFIYSNGFSQILDLVYTLNFTDFQLKLLREFSLILLGNSFLVLLAWKIYGPRISAKFGLTSRGSRRAIEELRLSMSELQLPKEHDFKFK